MTSIIPQEPTPKMLLEYARDGACFRLTAYTHKLSPQQMAEVQSHVVWLSNQVRIQVEENGLGD